MSEPGGQPSSANHPPDEAPIVRVLEICNKKGLHARASAKFVQTVEKFDAEVKVKRGNEVVGGTSIMGLMMLSAGPGATRKRPGQVRQLYKSRRSPHRRR